VCSLLALVILQHTHTTVPSRRGFVQVWLPPTDIASTIGYCYEGDSQIPELTVQETLQFMSDLSWPAMVGSKGTTLQTLYEAAQPELARTVVAQSMRDMHIDNVADTVVGGDLLRGVSGGQKKRVTVGEVRI
jgi:ATP-binding cassette subfamily G (WHITE) protein 2 (PDR)